MKSACQAAAAPPQHQDARKVALYIVEPLDEPLGRFVEQELRGAQARCALAVLAHRPAIEDQDLALAHRAI